MLTGKAHSRRLKQVPFISLLAIVIFSVVCLSAGSWPQVVNIAQEKPLQVNNKLELLEVVSAAKEKDLIRLSLRNNYSKSIDGFQVRVGNVSVQTEFLGSGITFSPGSIFEREYAIQQDLDKRGVTILCVVFEDGSSEGEPKYIKQIEDKRFGERVQTQRALSLIEKVLSSSEVNTPGALEKLKDQISSLPVEHDGGSNYDIMLGLQDRKTVLTHQIQSVQNKHKTLGGISVAEELSTLKQHFEQSLKKTDRALIPNKEN